MFDILAIEDDQRMRELLKEILSRNGCSVFTAKNGEEGIGLLERRTFDLIITDQIMSGMTGIDLVREIFKIRPEIPVILITGFSDEITSEVAKIEGVKEFILKPFNIEILSGIIRKLLDNS